MYLVVLILMILTFLYVISRQKSPAILRYDSMYLVVLIAMILYISLRHITAKMTSYLEV